MLTRRSADLLVRNGRGRLWNWPSMQPGLALISDISLGLFLTMALTVVTDLTIAISVGTVAGLAMRLIRKDVEPEDWTPEDRSTL